MGLVSDSLVCKVSLNILSAMVSNKNEAFCLAKGGNSISLLKLKPYVSDGHDVDKICEFKGKKGFILYIKNEQILISIDDKLILIKDSDPKVVLRAEKPSNYFLHAVEAFGNVFIHEYGEPPTWVYKSINFKSWWKVISNIEIDRFSRHFHCINYDPFREMLIATLGDGCRTKIAISHDCELWNIANAGLWQVLPIHVSKEFIAFGLDDPVSSGILLWNFKLNKFQTLHLKWNRYVSAHSRSFMRRLLLKKYCPAFMTDIKELNNGVWVAAFSIPQVVIASSDLINWYSLIEVSWKENFCWSNISEGRDYLLACVGNKLFIIRKNEISDTMKRGNIVAKKCKAVRENVMALIYRLRKLR